MVDLHSHILPEIDDGAASMEMAIEMAREAVSDGTSMIAATPHHNNSRYSNDKTAILEQVKRLNMVLAEHHIPLRVVGGQELRVNDQLWHEMESGNVLTLNESRYLLIELPSSTVPGGCEELIHELIVANYVPVIAHPERNAAIASNPELLDVFVKQGALAQITAGSLTGEFGSKLRKLSLQLYRGGLAHILASDAHDNDRRKFGLSSAYQVIRRELGEEFESYLRGNAEAMVEDQPIFVREIAHKANRKIRFWRK